MTEHCHIPTGSTFCQTFTKLRTEYERTHEIFLQPQRTKSIFADKHEKREYANFGTKKPVCLWWNTQLRPQQSTSSNILWRASWNRWHPYWTMFCCAFASPRNTITTRREGCCDMCGKYRKIAALNLEGGWTSHSMTKLCCARLRAPVTP